MLLSCYGSPGNDEALRDVTVTISHRCDMLLRHTTAPTAFPIVKLIIDASYAILIWLRDPPLTQS
jgi:hypothetical protein